MFVMIARQFATLTKKFEAFSFRYMIRGLGLHEHQMRLERSVADAQLTSSALSSQA